MSLDEQLKEELKACAEEQKRFNSTQPGYWEAQAHALEIIKPFYKNKPTLWVAYFNFYKSCLKDNGD